MPDWAQGISGVLLVASLVPQCSLWAQQEAIVSSEFIFEQLPTPECHASTIVETHEGMVAAWFGGTHESAPDVAIWFSRRDSLTWTKPVSIADDIQSDGSRLPCWNPVLFAPRSGPLLLFYKVGPNPRSWWGMVKRSNDGGRTWSDAQRLPDGVLGPTKNKPVQLSDGSLLCASSHEDGGWSVWFDHADSTASTWKSSGPMNDPRHLQAIQPAFLMHHDGRIQAVGRTQQDHVFTLESPDSGVHWGVMSLLPLRCTNSGIDAVVLRDGRSLIVYNHSQSQKDRWEFGRHVLNLAVSPDGETWFAGLVLEFERGAEFSYPAVIQSSDGLVHVTYTWKRTRIRHVVVDPRKVKGLPFDRGEWPETIRKDD